MESFYSEKYTDFHPEYNRPKNYLLSVFSDGVSLARWTYFVLMVVFLGKDFTNSLGWMG